MDTLILFISGVVFLGFMLVPLSKRLGAPILLIILIGGMLVGEDGPGNVDFDNFELAFSLGSVALAIILFAGGLETEWASLKGVRAVSISLASLGVLITAAIVGFAAYYLLGIPLSHGLLLGAVVASTDAAATFMLIQQSQIKLSPRLSNTLVFESGINDPMAIFLTISLTTLVGQGGDIHGEELFLFLPLFVQQIGVGTAMGVLGGLGLVKILDRIQLPVGLYPPMALAGAMGIFGATSILGGSGFLAIYLCGLIIAARIKQPLERILNFSEALQWLSQIVLFFMLGLLVTPSDLSGTVLPALMIAFVLMFFARPLAVAVCVLPARFTLKETLYLSWVGLRGAVPIFLAIFPVIAPGPIQTDFFNVVFIIVVVSLVLQGWTVAASAKWLGLVER
ncbi:MAG: potassium/proton antiporter [Alphaproteobacteria bacterium]|nr:potassium/proton antiporter [Alphaproteobacteria bacterium]